MYWGNHFWGMHMLWWMFWLALIAVLVFGIRPRHTARRDGALEVLRRRYASGEISDEEYRHRRTVLAGREGPLAPGAEAPQPVADASDHASRHDEPHSHSPSAA